MMVNAIDIIIPLLEPPDGDQEAVEKITNSRARKEVLI